MYINELLVLKHTHVYNIKHRGPGTCTKTSKIKLVMHDFPRKTRRTDILIHGQHREMGAILVLHKNLILSCTHRIQMKQPCIQRQYEGNYLVR